MPRQLSHPFLLLFLSRWPPRPSTYTDSRAHTPRTPPATLTHNHTFQQDYRTTCRQEGASLRSRPSARLRRSAHACHTLMGCSHGARSTRPRAARGTACGCSPACAARCRRISACRRSSCTCRSLPSRSHRTCRSARSAGASWRHPASWPCRRAQATWPRPRGRLGSCPRRPRPRRRCHCHGQPPSRGRGTTRRRS